MQACAQQYAQQAPYYSTEISAADLDTLRRRLGYTQFNLWGASYGTRVALNYTVQYPAFARSLVLDGLAPSLIALPAILRVTPTQPLHGSISTAKAIHCANSIMGI